MCIFAVTAYYFSVNDANVLAGQLC